MGHIIAGRFDAQESADHTHRALQDAGFEADSLSIFFVNPAGQHATHPVGGDEGASSGAKNADTGAWAGAGVGSVAGAAAGSVAGPVGAVIGGGVGAYTGSLAGALHSTDEAAETDKPDKAEPDNRITERKSGMHLAVNVSQSDTQQVIDLLRKNQAKDIEQAEGKLENSKWIDFDPTLAVRLV
ncbi:MULTISPECIES: hypothetical protein [unclassified Marinobacter]|uniref:hypothetical protein n=1 Tax=unclassified Marinobacter TaxID=83889 RepID=UPI000BF8D805|nr:MULTISPECIES: hypothetical protein [unclassified Marinobacter]PFG11654.1 hypothetical protein ATI45_4199 [Marinobacter sp. LV10MA510-1]PFG53476.1 hypothetical protein ATG98_2595 [Marinobacter sp. LV10R520-4]